MSQDISDIALPEPDEPVPFNPAPLWYQQARSDGCTPQELRPKICEFYLEALRHKDAPAIESVDESLLDVMMDMYEYAYREAASEEGKE